MWNPFKKITYQSPINGTITIGKRNNEKALFSGGVTQSGGEISPMWDTVIGKVYNNRHSGDPPAGGDSRIDSGQALRQAQDAARMTKGKNILILGVGGGSVLRAIRQHDTKASITGIEIDPVMKQVAMEQFGIEENKKQKIIINDAIAWIQKQVRIRGLVYDLIVVDLYIGRFNPPKTRTKIFLQQLKKLTKPNGVILYNAHFQKKNIGEYEAFRKMTDKIFSNAQEVFSYPLNRVLLLRI